MSRLFFGDFGCPMCNCQPRIHVYDVYNGDLLELENANGPRRAVFQDLDSALDAGPRSALEHAENSFHELESRAEVALSKVIHEVHHTGCSSSTSKHPPQICLDSTELSTIIQFLVFLRFRNSSKYQEIIKEVMEPSDLSLAVRSRGTRAETIFSIYNPFYRQVRIVSILTLFTQFFETPLESLPSSPSSVSDDNIDYHPMSRKDPCLNIIDKYFWKYCRQVEVCLGVPAEEEQEYILSDSCYGVLDSSFGSGASVGTGTGPEQNPETESYDSFFPILPTLAVYVIYNEDRDNIFPTPNPNEAGSDVNDQPTQVTLDVDSEMAVDIYLRNAMVLSNVPYNHQNRRPTHTFIPYNRIEASEKEEFYHEVEAILRMSSTGSYGTQDYKKLKEVPIPLANDAAGAILDGLHMGPASSPSPLTTMTHASSSPMSTPSPLLTPNSTTGISSAFSTTANPKLYFHSLSSIAKSISSYDEFRCRWIADKFIDYSRLKQRCRQKFCVEGVMNSKMFWNFGFDLKLPPGKVDKCKEKGKGRDEGNGVVVIDLTEEVKVTGDEPVAYGAFSDVWKGQWFDRVERKERAVAIKYLRQAMVQRVVRAKFVKRLQAEIVTWHQLCHRNLATLFGIIQNASSIGMVSLWCENGTIGQFLKRNPDKNKLRLLVQVASGVAYLHHFKTAVVHGDLKGSNILIDAHEQAIITDFGLTKVMEDLNSDSQDGSGADEVKVHTTSFFAGSTRWMAPELIQVLVEDDGGKIPRVTTHSDVYAFASVCLEVATGQLPYPHRSNDHAVTVDILRGVGPSRGTVFSSQQLGIGVKSTASSKSQSQAASAPSSSISTNHLPCPCSTNSSGSRLSAPSSSSGGRESVDHHHQLLVGKDSEVSSDTDQEDHDCFRVILERCWSQVPYLRPSMEEVLNWLTAMEA
ncbi:hypothetical protein D9758_011080 [Tetrapyrgos nigripes]|uniref:Protein kinase domain-containing protein n=1 Tax=Tetrapyrgos nigripes TaxID=182062 RepID=A0A8H5CSR5_9AGAR|nr:hypothetical protein D9758_011080 [Tetrapyrgos nigripes]